MNKIPEWHVVYKEWAIHTPTGRLRHLPCMRFVTEFARFKQNTKRLIPIKDKTNGHHFMVSIVDTSLHQRRELLLKQEEPCIHVCQGSDKFDETEVIEIPSMVVEIALCYMKV